ncbi:DUF3558 domain-containing protein [Nocardia cyriacigeorgica]|nr:DUF3558 domain-containing protein [Nocardia cyriacigeorgica]MBF6092307.1 DUF3558 domain-containing protein [Nocardia cyriacigeorgica]MBF6396900.1 DUF3558 domain-containing protein [Nocardia cyriacigeorgica]MBF6403442.1 DUF3558 domain-containing protein [Nocardia cyriacigeorgica]
MSALLFTGCSANRSESSSPSTTPAPTSPSISVTVKPAPTQYNQGRNHVAFDPCSGLGDDTIIRAGFDPATRERNDFTFDTYSFIGCTFKNRDVVGSQKVTVRTLRVSSSNITLDEFRARYQDTSSEIVINGAQALQYTNPDGTRDACNIAVESEDGVLDIGKIVSSPFTEEQPCEGIRDIAATIASAIPK